VTAISAAVRISERRSRLLGLDRPAGEADTPDVSALLAALTRPANPPGPKVYDA
jgi:hypothetical protein